MGGGRLTDQLRNVLLTELDDVDSEAGYHQRSILELQQRSSEVADLVSKLTARRRRRVRGLTGHLGINHCK